MDIRRQMFSPHAPRCAAAVALLVLIAGCAKKPAAAPPVHGRPRVQLVHPRVRTLKRTVGQPSFIDAYEQTAIYPKIAGYVAKWNVDIGDHVKKDQVLATLFVPELEAQYEQKRAIVTQDEVLIQVAKELVKVAEQNLNTAKAEVKKAQADLGSYQAAVERWESEVKRLTGLVAQKVVDRQVLDESEKQLKSNISMRDAAQASIAAAEAVVSARQTDVEKTRVDVEAAKAKAQVSKADAARYAALVSYTQLTAPFTGVIVVRNANTGDFAQPASGDKSAERGSPDQSAARGAPVYVVARTDIVRVFVDVPEVDANYVNSSTEAVVRVQALSDAEFQGTVTRTSWSLQRRTRTLRAEIDLPNPEAKLLPGMYAFAMVSINRPDVLAVPQECVIELGNQTYCYLLKDGRAIRTPVQTGISDGQSIEVVRRQFQGRWEKFSGDENIIVGAIADLTDGEAVIVGEHEPRFSSEAGSGGH